MTKRDKEMSEKMGVDSSYDLAKQIVDHGAPSKTLDESVDKNDQSTVKLPTELKQVNDFTKHYSLDVPKEKRRPGLAYKFIAEGNEGRAEAQGWRRDDVANLKINKMTLYCMPETQAKARREAAVLQAQRNEGSIDPYAIAERMGQNASPDLLPQGLRPTKQKTSYTIEKE